MLQGTQHSGADNVVLVLIESLLVILSHGRLIGIVNLSLRGIIRLVSKLFKFGPGILLKLSHGVSVSLVLFLDGNSRGLGGDLNRSVFFHHNCQRSSVRNESCPETFPVQHGQGGLGSRKFHSEFAICHSDRGVDSQILDLDADLFRGVCLERSFNCGLVRNFRAARDSGNSSHSRHNE